MGEHSVPAEQQALEEVSLVLHELVDALLEQEGHQWRSASDQAGDRATDTTEQSDDV